MTEPYAPVWEENRRPLDSRRLVALIIDGIVVAPVLIPLAMYFGRLNSGAMIMYLGFQLAYFHVMESRSGQTVGKRIMDLRVVRASDAGPASAAAISARTILRLIDGLPFANLVGILTVIFTGKRRQRLGDLAARTVVTRASTRSYTPARRSPLVTIYPMLWIGAALAVVLATGHRGEPFLADVDSLCQEMNRAAMTERDFGGQIRLRMTLRNQVLALDTYEPQMHEARNTIVRGLVQEINYGLLMMREFDRTRSQSEWESRGMTLEEMGYQNSQELAEKYGLDHC